MSEVVFQTSPKTPVSGKEVVIEVKREGKRSDYEWIFDSIALRLIHESNSTLKITPFLSGDYDIKYKTPEETFSYVLKVSKKEDLEAKDEIVTEEIADEKISELKIKPIYQDIPNFIKRNARYRGHRESEKFLSSHQEQLFDIRKNYENIEYETHLIKESISNWLFGEEIKKSKNHMINGEKVHQATSDISRYLISDDNEISHFNKIMVKLNNNIVDDYLYSLDGKYVVINIKKAINLETATLSIVYEAITQEGASITDGLHPIRQKIKSLTDRVSEMERRYMIYENAYK